MKKEYIPFVEELIELAIREDIGDGDHTSLATIPADARGKMQLLVKQRIEDGACVRRGDIAFYVEGRILSLLQAERIVLNIMQRMSGVATQTAAYVKLLEGTHCRVLDTRKTTPGMRVLDKMAVKLGGGENHRMGLFDMILLKDNHIGAAGSVTKAIQMAKAYAPFVRKIEIETETLDQVQEAVDAGADIIMLDNMDTATMKQALQIIDGRAQTECSGNVTKARLREIAETGVDFVSCGALTHSAPILDLSLKNLAPIE